MTFTLMTREGEAPGLWAFTADRDVTLDDLQGKVGGQIEIVGYGGSNRRFGGLRIALTDGCMCLASQHGYGKHQAPDMLRVPHLTKEGCSGEIQIDDWLCLADEEGMIKDLAVNPWASVLCGQPILGNAVIVPRWAFHDHRFK